jgi:cytidine deaminase
VTGVGSTEPSATVLVEKAEAASAHAYAPYSNYLVGAIVRTNDGNEFAGVNVESAAYPLGICAERSALSAAAAAGYKPGDVSAIGISAAPCGGCRQWLHEWRIPEVSYRRADGSIGRSAPSDLLPDTWELPA